MYAITQTIFIDINNQITQIQLKNSVTDYINYSFFYSLTIIKLYAI